MWYQLPMDTDEIETLGHRESQGTNGKDVTISWDTVRRTISDNC